MDYITMAFEESLELKQAVEINNALAIILGNAQLLLLKNTVNLSDQRSEHLEKVASRDI